MNTISEPTLAECAKNGSVTRIKVVPNPEGLGFLLYVNLAFKSGDFLLVTQRKIPRTWQSADRLFKHIDQSYRKISSFHIYLEGSE